MEWRGGHTGIRGPDAQKGRKSERKVSPPHTGVNQNARQGNIP